LKQLLWLLVTLRLTAHLQPCIQNYYTSNNILVWIIQHNTHYINYTDAIIHINYSYWLDIISDRYNTNLII
jgi:hypothetical protein